MPWVYECTDGAMRPRRNCHRVWHEGRYWYVAGAASVDTLRTPTEQARR